MLIFFLTKRTISKRDIFAKNRFLANRFGDRTSLVSGSVLGLILVVPIDSHENSIGSARKNICTALLFRYINIYSCNSRSRYVRPPAVSLRARGSFETLVRIFKLSYSLRYIALDVSVQILAGDIRSVFVVTKLRFYRILYSRSCYIEYSHT